MNFYAHAAKLNLNKMGLKLYIPYAAYRRNGPETDYHFYFGTYGFTYLLKMDNFSVRFVVLNAWLKNLFSCLFFSKGIFSCLIAQLSANK